MLWILIKSTDSILWLTVYTRLLVYSGISGSVAFCEKNVQNQRLEYKSNLKNKLNEKDWLWSPLTCGPKGLVEVRMDQKYRLKFLT